MSDRERIEPDNFEQDVLEPDVFQQGKFVPNVLEPDVLEQKDSEMKSGSRFNIMNESFHMLFYLILVFLSAYMITQFIGQRTQVIGKSMENTLYDQDSLIIDKISYHFLNPKRYDIVVFPVTDTLDGISEKVYYIKRIIGLPGDVVQIIDGEIYINNERLEEKYGKEKIDVNNAGLAAQPIHLAEDEYFVLGDNRNHSQDSRALVVGNVSKSSIIGKAWIRVWPFNHFGILKHQ